MGNIYSCIGIVILRVSASREDREKIYLLSASLSGYIDYH